MSQIPICVELIVVVAVIRIGSGWAGILEAARVPVIMHRMVELAKVEFWVIQVLLGE